MDAVRSVETKTLIDYSSELSVLVHGNLSPIILFQLIFISRYNVTKTPMLLRIIVMIMAVGLLVFVNCEIMLWTNGRPSNTPIHTMNSLYKKTPANTETANFHGLYFVRPKVI